MSREERIAAARARAAAAKRPETAADGSPNGAGAGAPPSRRQLKTRLHNWLRVTHVYIGMFSMLAVLFFATTGLLLNNPTWTLGTGTSTTTAEGTLPAEAISSSEIEYLAVDIYLRDVHGVKGDVVDYGESSGEASITYKSPGYAAYAYFDVATGDYTLSVTTSGLIGTFNDMHTGNNTGSVWTFLINVVAVSLMVIALTGLGIQYFLRKRRLSAFTTAAVGVVLLILVFTWVIVW